MFYKAGESVIKLFIDYFAIVSDVNMHHFMEKDSKC